MNVMPFCKYIHLLGTQLSLCSKAKLLSIIQENITLSQKLLVLSGNIHAFNLAYESPLLRDFFNQADIVRLDGEGLRWGARLLGYTTPQRMTFSDFAWDLAALAASNGFSLFLLGDKPGVADKAAIRLKERFPALQIAGTHHGYFDKTPGSPENEAIIQRINAIKPNILIVGFGMPMQEFWLIENLGRLEVNVALSGGAVFAYISGELYRGPKWMTNHGFEWLARLLIEPRRLWKRYIIGIPLFFFRVLKQRFGIK